MEKPIKPVPEPSDGRDLYHPDEFGGESLKGLAFSAGLLVLVAGAAMTFFSMGFWS